MFCLLFVSSSDIPFFHVIRQRQIYLFFTHAVVFYTLPLCAFLLFFSPLTLLDWLFSLFLCFFQGFESSNPTSNLCRWEAVEPSSYEGCGSLLLRLRSWVPPFANLVTLGKLLKTSVPQFVPHELTGIIIVFASPSQGYCKNYQIIKHKALKILLSQFRVNTW